MKPIFSAKVIALTLTVVFLASMTSSLAVTIEPGKYGGTFTIAILGEEAHLNPAITSSHGITVPAGICYEGLVWWPTPLSQPQPLLAESWEISSDSKTYTFHLVRNATWHDGVPFTSADVKFSIEKVLSQFHPIASTLLKSRLDRVDTPDNYTAIVRLKSPCAFLLYFMDVDQGAGAIIPKHCFDFTNSTDLFNNPNNSKPIGTGPFKFVKWEKGNYIEFDRNPNYWKSGLPYLDKVIYRIMRDADSLVVALETGEIQGHEWGEIPLGEYNRLSKLPNLKASTAGELDGGANRLIINMRTNTILNNKLVRQALQWALNKTELARVIYASLSPPSWSIVRGDWIYFNPALVNSQYQNFTKSNELLDQAGYPKDAGGTRFNLRLYFYSGSETYENAGRLIQDWFKQVGISIDYQPLDRATANSKVWNYDFDLFLCTSSTMPHPAVMMARLLHSSRIDMKGLSWHNVGAYNNSRVDYLLDSYYTETDPAKLRANSYELQDILNEDLPIIDVVDAFYPKIWSADYGNYGLSAGWAGGEGQWEYVYWKLGSNVSPQSALAAIQKAGKDLDNLQGQFYDVSAARKRLADAQTAYDAGDWATASSLASTAADLANPPYLMYAIIAIVIVAIVVIGVLYWRRRKKKQ